MYSALSSPEDWILRYLKTYDVYFFRSPKSFRLGLNSTFFIYDLYDLSSVVKVTYIYIYI